MVTLREVAQAVGVSVSTASRALSSPERVSPTTRARVSAAAEALNYRPNRAASLLRSGRTGAIGLLVPDLENPYFASITKGVQARARDAHLAAVVMDSDESPANEQQWIRTLVRQTDGIVLCAPRSLERDVPLLDDVPVVLVNATRGGFPSVWVDYADAMVQAVTHLRALGHRKIAYVGGPTTSWADRQRREGLADAGKRFPELEIVALGSFAPRVEGGRAAADLAAASEATAVIAFNDLVAVGLIARLASRGLSIPQQMSVMGSDDTFVAQMTVPQLTTLRIDLRNVGARAVDLLAPAAIGGSRPADSDEPQVRVTAELIVRPSTATPPVG